MIYHIDLGSAPVSLIPVPLRWIVGKVVNPTSTVLPVTAIETGELPLVNPASLPQENLPTGSDDEEVVASPTIDEPESM